MKKTLILLVFILALTACVPAAPRPTQPPGIFISDLITSMGGEPDHQTLSYTVTLRNQYSYNMQIDWVHPLLSKDLQPMTKDIPLADLMVKTNQLLRPGESMTVKGKIILNTADITKQQIAAIDQLITGFQLSNGEAAK